MLPHVQSTGVPWGTAFDTSLSQWAMTTVGMTLLIIVVLWGVVWKGIALWKAARRDQSVWYLLLLVINTVGLLEIIYIFFIAPRHRELHER